MRIPISPKERRRIETLLVERREGDAPEREFAVVAERISGATRENNRNNATRTKAYYEFYRRFPEVHWAFLAHMVSRNGGWNMTDLQGELIPRLLGEAERSSIFSMLEQANALIFGDAFPQLLLYEESVREGKPLFFLLPVFGISSFMRPVWERFWETRDSALLTVSLIVNEQHFIEGRVVEEREVQRDVLGTLPYRAQEALGLNQVYFPFSQGGLAGRQRLAGLHVGRFGDLQDRIRAGKRLYAALFGIPLIRDGAERFALRTVHTGSRSDYWPELFTAIRPRAAQAAYRQRLDGYALRPEAQRLYSPRLSDAWNDRPLPVPERRDWLRDPKDACSYLTDAVPPRRYAMSRAACRALATLELAVLAREALPLPLT